MIEPGSVLPPDTVVPPFSRVAGCPGERNRLAASPSCATSSWPAARGEQGWSLATCRRDAQTSCDMERRRPMRQALGRRAPQRHSKRCAALRCAALRCTALHCAAPAFRDLQPPRLGTSVQYRRFGALPRCTACLLHMHLRVAAPARRPTPGAASHPTLHPDRSHHRGAEACETPPPWPGGGQPARRGCSGRTSTAPERAARWRRPGPHSAASAGNSSTLHTRSHASTHLPSALVHARHVDLVDEAHARGLVGVPRPAVHVQGVDPVANGRLRTASAEAVRTRSTRASNAHPAAQ